MFTVKIPKTEIITPVKEILVDGIKQEFFNLFKQDEKLKNLEDHIILKFSEISSKILYHNIEEDRKENE